MSGALLRFGVLFLLLISGHGPVEATASETITMNSFSLQTELRQGWETKVDTIKQSVTFEKKKGKIVSSILVRERDASKLYSGIHTEQWVADAYRRGEESDMIARGVMTGMYKLSNVEKHNINVDGKNMYTMTYLMEMDGYVAHGYLYLYFPDFKAQNRFFVFLYTFFHPTDEHQNVNLQEFYSIIRSFCLTGQ